MLSRQFLFRAGLIVSLAVGGGSLLADESLEGQTLLASHWHQTMPYSACTPNHQPLGCHSLAYAQILAYHRLTPHGSVEFRTSSGVEVAENLDDYHFDAETFPSEVTDSTPAAIADQVAEYCYLVSAVCRKDFGTDQYLARLHTRAIAAHFNCETKLYLPIGAAAQAEVRQVIVDEIEARRPVYFHYNRGGGMAHSVVIDGYRRAKDRFEVHVAYGSADPKQTAWYDLDKGIDAEDRPIEPIRLFETIRPLR